MLNILSYDLLLNSLLAGVLAALICGIIGSLIVVKRVTFLAGGVAHSAYGGVGIAFYFALPVFPTTLIFTWIITLIMGKLTLEKKHQVDSVVSVLWAGGMAMGIVLTDLTPGKHGELLGYLFGSILTVTSQDVLLLLYLSIGILVIVLYYYRDFLVMAFDQEFARVQGIPVNLLYYVLLLLVGTVVVAVVHVVGLILILALMTIAPLIIESYVKSLYKMMIWSVCLNFLFTISGLYLSLFYDLEPSASIILTAVLVYLLLFFLTRLLNRLTRLLKTLVFSKT